MKMNSRIIAAALAALLISNAASAQDLQYRMVVTAQMPGMEGDRNMPVRSMTMYHKGSKMRMETDGPVDMVAIIDRTAGRIVVLDDEEKEYQEQPFTLPKPSIDSARLSALGNSAGQFRDTGDTLTINGYKTRRFLATMEIPFNPLPAGKREGRFLMIMESWASTDPVLMEAYRLFQAFSVGMPRPGAEPSMLTEMTATGFPLRSTTMMVSLPDTASYDVDSIMKAGAGAPGLQMRMATEMQDIKTGSLDPALFEVPKDYRKVER